jgi:asparagine synthase (glutamine-hydrolysing)
MLKAIANDPSYKSGSWSDEVSGTYVGWTSLKDSPAEKLPIFNEQNNSLLIFAGEEFADSEAVQHLKKKGHFFPEDGVSHLIHMAEEDSRFPLSLNGRFHGVLIHKDKCTARLFNDRYGLRRLYYHESSEGFYFAAEAKAILAVIPVLRTSDSRSMGEFIACGCVLENRTLFSGIQVLPPAASWSFRQGEIEQKASYFCKQEWENQEQLNAETYYQEFRSTFSRILPKYFSGVNRIGISLTGGLDSRMIMAWAAQPKGSLPCYSFGGSFRDCEDVKLARKVAEMCGQSYQVIPVASEFLSRFAHYAERTVFLTDGCAGVGRSPDLFANEKAAAIAPVRMTGNYGSEILRRLVAFKPVDPFAELFVEELSSHIKRARETYRELRKGNALSFIAFRQTPWHHYGLCSLEETQLTLRSPYLDNDLVRVAFQAPDSSVAKSDHFAGGEDCVRLIGDGNPALQKLRTDRGFGGDSGSFRSAISKAWLEFTFKAEYAYDYGMPQTVARIDNLFSPLHLERLFLGRHKFIHFRFWYREALSEYVREMLLDSRTLNRPYLNRKRVEEVVKGHLTGGRNYTTEIHQLLTLELIHRIFLD